MSGRKTLILRSHARLIKQLGRRVARDVIEIGRRLADAKRLVGHGQFVCWIAAEFGWSQRTAENFMRVHERASKNAKFANLSLPVSALYLLAAPSTPDAAIDEAARLAGEGAGLSVQAVKHIIVTAHRNSPTRRRMMTAQQILTDAMKIWSLADAERALDERLVELEADERERVRYIIGQLIIERLRNRGRRLSELEREIEKLESLERRLQNERDLDALHAGKP